MKVGDMVRLRKVAAWLQPHTDKRGKIGVVIEIKRDAQHGKNVYYVSWANNTQGWVYQPELEVISES